MFDTTFFMCLLFILIFFGSICFMCWWDLNGYKVKENRRMARQKLIDAANEAKEKTEKTGKT